MRATVGLAVARAVAFAAALGAGVGCGHDSKPVVQPDEHPPLPPAVQRVIARRVLSDRGVDLDAGRPQPTPARGEESAEPAEPDGADTGSGAGSGSD